MARPFYAHTYPRASNFDIDKFTAKGDATSMSDRNMSRSFANPQQQRQEMQRDADREQRIAATQKAQQQLMKKRNEIAQHLIRNGRWSDAKMLPTPEQIMSTNSRDLRDHEGRIDRIAGSAGFQPKQDANAMQFFEPRGETPKQSAAVPQGTPQPENQGTPGTAGPLGSDEPEDAVSAGTESALDEQNEPTTGAGGVKARTGRAGQTGNIPIKEDYRPPGNQTASPLAPLAAPQPKPWTGGYATRPEAPASQAAPKSRLDWGWQQEYNNLTGPQMQKTGEKPQPETEMSVRDRKAEADRRWGVGQSASPLAPFQQGQEVSPNDPRVPASWSAPTAPTATEVSSYAGLDPSVTRALDIPAQYGGGVATARGPQEQAGPPHKSMQDWHAEIASKYPNLGSEGHRDNKMFTDAYNTAQAKGGMTGEQAMALADKMFKPVTKDSDAIARTRERQRAEGALVSPTPPYNPPTATTPEQQRTNQANDPVRAGFVSKPTDLGYTSAGGSFGEPLSAFSPNPTRRTPKPETVVNNASGSAQSASVPLLPRNVMPSTGAAQAPGTAVQSLDTNYTSAGGSFSEKGNPYDLRGQNPEPGYSSAGGEIQTGGDPFDLRAKKTSPLEDAFSENSSAGGSFAPDKGNPYDTRDPRYASSGGSFAPPKGDPYDTRGQGAEPGYTSSGGDFVSGGDPFDPRKKKKSPLETAFLR